MKIFNYQVNHPDLYPDKIRFYITYELYVDLLSHNKYPTGIPHSFTMTTFVSINP